MPSKSHYLPSEPRKSHATSALLALLGLLLVIGAWRWLSQRSKPLPIAADLYVVAGPVRVARADAGEDPPYAAGAATRLQRGDELLLGQGALTRLSFGEGEELILSGGAHLEILELHRSPLTRGLVATVVLHQGKTYSDLRTPARQGTQYVIETRVATVQASGTAFACEVLDKERVWVAVHQGAVTVSMGEQALTLQSGQALEVRLGQALVPTGAPPAPTALAITPASPVATSPASTAAPAAWSTATLTDLQKTLFPPARTPTRPGDNLLTYTVQPGDTLYSIAQRYGLSWEALWQANKATLPKPEMLRAGQQIIIPLPRPAP